MATKGTKTSKLPASKFAFDKTIINGKHVGAKSGNTFKVLNPSTGDVVAEVPEMGKVETQEAIQAAYDTFYVWRDRPHKERSDILRRWFNLIKENREELARILTLENGKVYAEALQEVDFGAEAVEWFSEEARRIFGDVVPSSRPNNRAFQLKQPVGVCGLITPFNFPNATVTRKLAPALAAGCTMVLRPSEETPLSAIALAQLAERAGVPAGVLNVVTSSRDNAGVIGETLCASTLVQKMSFTGSTFVGKLLYKQCADTVKRLSLELGGNAPFIVFDSADVDKAVQAALGLKFLNCGQVCITVNRLLVQDGIHDRFVAALHKAMGKLKTGDGFDSSSTQGPLITARAHEKVSSLVEDAISKGATVHNGGKPHALGGNFYENTLLSGISLDMRVAKEEIFGPVASVIRFKTEEEALTIANSTNVGLAGYFFSQDISQIIRVGEKMETGMVGANETALADPEMAFGGVKQSGLGREGSKYGIEEFLEIKLLSLGI